MLLHDAQRGIIVHYNNRLQPAGRFERINLKIVVTQDKLSLIIHLKFVE